MADRQLSLLLANHITPGDGADAEAARLLTGLCESIIRERIPGAPVLQSYVIAGSQAKRYHIRDHSDFDVLMIFDQNVARAQADPRTHEVTLFDAANNPISASIFSHHLLNVVGRAREFRNNNNIQITLQEMRLPVTHLTLRITSRNLSIEADILCAIRCPNEEDSFYVPYGGASNCWYPSNTAVQRRVARQTTATFPRSRELIRLLKFIKYRKNWMIPSFGLELLVFHFTNEPARWDPNSLFANLTSVLRYGADIFGSRNPELPYYDRVGRLLLSREGASIISHDMLDIVDHLQIVPLIDHYLQFTEGAQPSIVGHRILPLGPRRVFFRYEIPDSPDRFNISIMILYFAKSWRCYAGAVRGINLASREAFLLSVREKRVILQWRSVDSQYVVDIQVGNWPQSQLNHYPLPAAAERDQIISESYATEPVYFDTFSPDLTRVQRLGSNRFSIRRLIFGNNRDGYVSAVSRPFDTGCHIVAFKIHNIAGASVHFGVGRVRGLNLNSRPCRASWPGLSLDAQNGLVYGPLLNGEADLLVPGRAVMSLFTGNDIVLVKLDFTSPTPRVGWQIRKRSGDVHGYYYRTLPAVPHVFTASFASIFTDVEILPELCS